ncbi:ankyrin repeat-containing protein [Malassezia brasiliensis]|uniref:Ankyrin repeat-containing protein n=1 Tax=Malassezia brasiliensis TaxID=1821822 RepID=A0AAF0DUH5_9BASI|nr:ankyrin repeat-containing protein [Malassezia brasiliensis]
MTKLTEEQRDDVLYAARAGDLEALNETIKELGGDRTHSIRAILETTNDQGNTPLHFAAANGHTDVVQALLAEGTLKPLLSQNAAGNTPLHWAAFNGHVDVAAALVDRIEALETAEPEQAKELRAAEDQREKTRHEKTKTEGESEADVKAERERHEEQQRERAIWDIRNDAGRGPMSEAQMVDREDVVQMLLGRLAQHDKGSVTEPPAEAAAPVDEVETKTAQLDIQ